MDIETPFGPRIDPDTPITGYVSVATPLDGCVDTLPYPDNRNASALNFICLIRNGKCSTVKKIHAAQSGGYIAAIIYGNVNADVHLKRNSAYLLNISSVLIGYSDGEEIRLNYSNKDCIVQIFSDAYVNIGFYLIPLATCLFIFVVGGCGLYMYRYFNQRNRRRRCCLPSSQLKSLRVLTFKKGETTYDLCVICLEEYTDGDKLRILPCEHAYHSRCVDMWLVKRRRVCPICKKKISRRLRLKQAFERRLRPTSSTAESQYLLDSSDSSDEADNLSQSVTNLLANDDQSNQYPETSNFVPDENTPLLNQSLGYASTAVTDSNERLVGCLIHFDGVEEAANNYSDDTPIIDFVGMPHTSATSHSTSSCRATETTSCIYEVGVASNRGPCTDNSQFTCNQIQASVNTVTVDVHEECLVSSTDFHV